MWPAFCFREGRDLKQGGFRRTRAFTPAMAGRRFLRNAPAAHNPRLGLSFRASPPAPPAGHTFDGTRSRGAKLFTKVTRVCGTTQVLPEPHAFAHVFRVVGVSHYFACWRELAHLVMSVLTVPGRGCRGSPRTTEHLESVPRHTSPSGWEDSFCRENRLPTPSLNPPGSTT